MESYRTEEEQLEALKRWWAENGRSTITAVIFALALGFGWQGWQQYRKDQAETASNSYQLLLQKLSQNDESGAAEAAADLKRDYSGSTYAQFASLHLARLAVLKGDLAKAETELRWVLEHADRGSETMQVAQLRLARVLAAAGDPQQALSILDQAEPGSFQAGYEMARGDMLLMLSREDEAREAYNSALSLAGRDGGPVNAGMLRAKLQHLSPEAPRALEGGATTPAEAAGAAQPGEAAPAGEE